MFAEVVVVSLSLFTIYFLESIANPPLPVLNIYRKTDAFYYVKFAFMFLVLHLRKVSVWIFLVTANNLIIVFSKKEKGKVDCQ